MGGCGCHVDCGLERGGRCQMESGTQREMAGRGIRERAFRKKEQFLLSCRVRHKTVSP